MTREEARRTVVDFRLFLAPVLRLLGERVGAGGDYWDGAQTNALDQALDLLLRSDSDVRREERERCARTVEELGRWADCDLDPAATAKAIRALEDER